MSPNFWHLLLHDCIFWSCQVYIPFFWLFLIESNLYIFSKKTHSLQIKSTHYVKSTKHFLIPKTTKFYNWRNKNFVDPTKYFSKCEFNESSRKVLNKIQDWLYIYIYIYLNTLFPFKFFYQKSRLTEGAVLLWDPFLKGGSEELFKFTERGLWLSLLAGGDGGWDEGLAPFLWCWGLYWPQDWRDK